jgi:hypothetical protein
MKRFLVSLLLVLVPLQLGFLYLKNPPLPTGTVAGIKSKQVDEIINSAFIGEFRFSLYGYTSPYALVTFEGMGIFDQTTANDIGFFAFNNRFSPFSKREACLSSKDQFGRISSPVCLPPFPVNYNVSIGPVIMPPTLSLDKKDYFMGDRVMLAGQAVPNTDVNLSVFGDNDSKIKSPLSFSLIKPVEAFTFPELTAKSDDKGNFSVNLPSSDPRKFRLFAQANYKKDISPNSIKLNLDILPVWMVIIKFLLFLLSLIKPRLLEILIIAEIIYIIYVIKNHIQSKAIVLYESHLPAVEESHLPEIEENHLPIVEERHELVKN